MPRAALSAGLLLLGWLITLISFLRADLLALPIWSLLLIVLVRTSLQTGLFITAHDAMHGLLMPGARRWNHRLGALCLTLYAGLPYGRCLRKHHWHHSHSGSAQDPDFCVDPSVGAPGWYCRFLAGYLSGSQMCRLLISWLLFGCVFSSAEPRGWINLLLVCVLPLVLSSLQLFVFGTYLPHRAQQGPEGRDGPCSLDLPGWLSLVTCFHFGYHREHHEHVHLAWFDLPSVRYSRSRQLAAS